MMVGVFYFLNTPGVSGKIVGSLTDSRPLVTLVGCKKAANGCREERKEKSEERRG